MRGERREAANILDSLRYIEQRETKCTLTTKLILVSNRATKKKFVKDKLSFKRHNPLLSLGVIHSSTCEQMKNVRPFLWIFNCQFPPKHDKD